ncbi:uncharacterized protein K452DRAFT_323098 [Aplosporella prunicola CBS 121167]|uniref:Very long-chain fatty acid transport protein n=1 Tax=Aplosporella prunicola CBS 121167 TaxID=1176127 RepID=A0A6A6ATM9_9PEZI|nr:uncharacterized protein K452DRAFT_323098 [Aplosporella prunicola CBS 121167]KAF2135372.1 hypothetical protein K452DRAFT_323098 [Aplosporella prunicola CBS 121167]
MDLAPAAAAAAAVAGATAAAAYLDAKLHLRKDLRAIWTAKMAEREFATQGKQDRYSLWYNFEAQVNRLPADEQCLWSRTGSYTWQETHAHSCRYAQFLLEAGVHKGDLVALYLLNSPEFVFSTLGSWSIGSAPALINNNLGGASLVHCLKISGAKVLLADGDAACRQRVEEARREIEEAGLRILFLDDETKTRITAQEVKRPERKHREGVKGDFPMCLLYTSGSTGLPKACPFPLARASVLCSPRARSLGITPGPKGDRWYNCMPMYHGTGFTTTVTCLCIGTTLCIGKKFSTSGFWSDIRDSDSTAFVYVGETVRYLLATPPSPHDKSHRVRVMFGNGLRPDVWKRFSERFGIECVSEFFNSTEGVFALLNVCRGPYQQSAVGHHGAIMRAMLHNVFVPVEIDHESGGIWRDPKSGFAKRKPYDEGGEIIVKVSSEKAFVGYWKNADATSKKFERNVFKRGDLYYRTGDALRRTPDGRWFFLDRLGDTYRWKSENVSTAEVSEAMDSFPGVVEAIVYGVEVAGHDGRAGCAALFVPPAQRDRFDMDALLRHARARLPKYAVPVFLRLMATLTPMHNNKQNKTPLRAEGIDVERIRAGAMPEDRMMWLPEAVGMARPGTGYVEFGARELEALRARARAALGEGGGEGGEVAKL